MSDNSKKYKTARWLVLTIGGSIAMAAMILMSSCTKEKIYGDQFLQNTFESRYISVDAGLPHPACGEKAYLETATGKVKWQPNDAMSFNGTNLSVSEIYSAEDSTKARFTGSVPANTTEPNHDIYWAVYPSRIYNAGTVYNTLKIDLPETYSYDMSKATLHDFTYMAGYAKVASGENNINFVMKNLVALLKLPVKSTASNKKLKKIVVSVENHNLHGTFTTSDPTVAISGGTYGVMTINCKNGPDDYIALSSSAQDIYIAIPPLTISSPTQLVLRLYNDDNYYTEKRATLPATNSSNNNDLQRNSIYSLPETDAAFDYYEGLFSVSSSGKIIFSPGNLQYQASTGTWRFAEHQWDYIGNAPGNNVSNNRNAQTSWIDFFGWGTSGWNSGATEYQPWSSVAGYGRYYPGNGSDNDLTETYAQADWGVYNSIGSDSAGTWRTPTKDEWEYLINTRNTTSGIRYAKATVNGVKGLIIVPDNWSTSTYAFNSNSTNSQTAAYTTNNINAATWTTLENAGCVFLPNAGHRSGIQVDHQGVSGFYWSSTHYSSEPPYASILYVADNEVGIGRDDKSNGASVRLIKEF